MKVGAVKTEVYLIFQETVFVCVKPKSVFITFQVKLVEKLNYSVLGILFTSDWRQVEELDTVFPQRNYFTAQIFISLSSNTLKWAAKLWNKFYILRFTIL